MKNYTKLIAIAVITSTGITSCVQPTGTPEQQAQQTAANGQLAAGVGVGLMGVGTALSGAAQLNNSNRGRYYYGGRYYNRRGWRNGAYYYY
jgi:hypothetical protein